MAVHSEVEIYRAEPLIEACTEIAVGYRRNISYVFDKMKADPYFTGGSRARITRGSCMT